MCWIPRPIAGGEQGPRINPRPLLCPRPAPWHNNRVRPRFRTSATGMCNCSMYHFHKWLFPNQFQDQGSSSSQEIDQNSSVLQDFPITRVIYLDPRLTNEKDVSLFWVQELERSALNVLCIIFILSAFRPPTSSEFDKKCYISPIVVLYQTSKEKRIDS